MANISPTIKIDISYPLCIMEKISMVESYSLIEVAEFKLFLQDFFLIFTWSYKKMSGLHPAIVEHHINTWPNASPIC